MKKFIIVFAVVLIGAGAGIPYFNGLIMENIVRRSMQNINQAYADSGSDIKLEIQEYERGFSRSIIEWKIDLGAISNIYGIDEILFIEEAEHGYKGVVSETRLDKNQWFTDFVENQLDGKNPVHIHTVYALAGDMVTTVDMDAFSLDNGNGVKGNIKPATWTFSMDKAFQNMGSRLSWQGCEVPDKLVVAGVGFNTRMKKISNHIWAGQSLFNLAGFHAADKGEQVDVKQARLETHVDYDKDKNQLSVSMGLGCDLLMGNNIEPLKDAFVRIGVNHMDAQGYERIAQLYAAMVKNMMKAMGERGFHPDRMERIIQQQMAEKKTRIIAEAEKLLKTGLEIRISDLKASLPQGKISGDFSLSLRKDMTLAQFRPIMMQPKLALDVFSLHSRLSLPESLADRNPDLMELVIWGKQTGLLTKTGTNLTHEVQTLDGKLVLNQKTIMTYNKSRGETVSKTARKTVSKGWAHIGSIAGAILGLLGGTFVMWKIHPILGIITFFGGLRYLLTVYPMT